jgi:hypothetical protein
MYDRKGEDKIRDLNLDTRRIHPYSTDEFGLVWLDSDSWFDSIPRREEAAPFQRSGSVRRAKTTCPDYLHQTQGTASIADQFDGLP